jgi:FAD:protein FMN transferase
MKVIKFNKKNLVRTFLKFTAIVLLINLCLACNNEPKMDYFIASGPIQGTMYNITYQWHEDISAQIDSVLHSFNKSLSNFDENSTISRINRNETDIVDELFMEMYYVAHEVHHNTEGAFDITVAPIANLWSFGWKNNTIDEITPETIDSLLQFVGMDKVDMQGYYVLKEKPEIQFIGNAIAQGQSADYLAKFLKDVGLKNFLVEIGGELTCIGKNPDENKWRVGIDKPIEGSGYENRENQAIVHLSDKSIATSGNYRKYIEQDGQKHGHSLNPVTGYPAINNLLSVTVITEKCIFADAYATAFMVLGLEKSIAITEKLPDIEAYFIYEDDNGIVKDIASSGFESYFKE